MPSIRSCEVVSNLKNKDKILFDLDQMKSVLESKKCIEKFAYIVHDSDEYTADDEQANPEHIAGELKPEHIHLLLKFHSNQPQKIDYVAKWFGLKSNFVEKIKSSWENACLYLIHRNAPDKFQYEIEDVNANFDYESVVQNDNQKEALDSIIEKILDGTIREYNKTQMIDGLTLVKNARLINEAFKTRADILLTTQQERSTECIFITGPSGVGKTTLAKRFAKEHGLPYYVSSGSNDIMDGYMQQPCLILDDMRPSSLGLSDLLKLLDPHTACSVKSRYKNKYLNCELIIITTVLDLDSFYSGVFSEEEEPITQLKRRCQTHIYMDQDTIEVSRWDQRSMRYVSCQAYHNNLLDDLIPDSPLTEEEMQRQLGDLLSFLTPSDSAYTLTRTGVYDNEKQIELSDGEFQRKKGENHE